MPVTSQIERPASGAVFRPEIEGLRAVAAALVAIFHIWLGRVSGGVDVFFVVSGFLITTGLVSRIERTGSAQLTQFWGRLITRLLPASLTVLLAIIATSLLLLPESLWKETIKQVAAATVYIQNWALAANSVDYLAQGGPVSPVQHYWALSTQGQFYLLWPLLFIFVAWLARRTLNPFRSIAAGAMGVLFLLSIGFSIWITNENQPLAYFNTLARVWEFCIGGLLAIFIERIVLSRGVRIVLGWIGLLAILSCGLLLQVSTVFPGYAALWPTLAGALVIIAGTTGSPIGVDRFLGSKAMVYFGSISYGFYLWHFPLLIFYRLSTPTESIGLLTGAGIMAVAIALAMLTRRFIESPVKQARIGSQRPWRAFAFGAACGTPVVIGLAAWTFMFFDARQLERQIEAIGNPDYPGAMALTENFEYQGAVDVEVYPGPHTVLDDREYAIGQDCGRPYSDVVPADCTVAGEPGMPTIAVVGGSHSAQWLPALQDIGNDFGWRIVNYTKDNCAFHLADEKLFEREWQHCGEWNRSVFERIETLDPDAVFLTSTRYLEGDEFIPESYVSAWQSLGDIGIDVIALRDNPAFNDNVSACVELHGADEPKCARRRAEIIEAISPVELLDEPPGNVHFIELTDYFCDAMTCPPVVGNVMLYRHGNHITATYVRTLGPMLEGEIRRVAEQIPTLAPMRLTNGKPAKLMHSKQID